MREAAATRATIASTPATPTAMTMRAARSTVRGVSGKRPAMRRSTRMKMTMEMLSTISWVRARSGAP